MPVPGYETIMLPLLNLLADKKEHLMNELTNELAKHFNLTDGEFTEMLPSGMQTKFKNRVGWARTYMAKAGLMQSTGKGRVIINQRGLDMIAKTPAGIDADYLSQFPEFVEFKSKPKDTNPIPSATAVLQVQAMTQTPQEVLENAHQALQESLASELLLRIQAAPPQFFERLVVDLLLAMGYGGSRQGAGRAIGQSGDGGIDGTIDEDKLGLDVVYLQAKRWDGTVGRPQIQAFAGALEGNKATKGVFITTSQFSKDAIDYVGRIQKKIVLIDGLRLAQLLIEHEVGVTPVNSYKVYKVDADRFADE